MLRETHQASDEIILEAVDIRLQIQKYTPSNYDQLREKLVNWIWFAFSDGGLGGDDAPEAQRR